MLPVLPSRNVLFQRTDTSAHLTVAAAIATVLKMLFGKLEAPGQNMAPPKRILMEEEIDLYLSQIALSRLVSASEFPSDVYSALREGQDIGLHVMRDVLQRANVSSSLTLRDFDGGQRDLVASQRDFGSAYIQMFIDGQAVQWPADSANGYGHLTEVI